MAIQTGWIDFSFLNQLSIMYHISFLARNNKPTKEFPLKFAKQVKINMLIICPSLQI